MKSVKKLVLELTKKYTDNPQERGVIFGLNYRGVKLILNE